MARYLNTNMHLDGKVYRIIGINERLGAFLVQEDGHALKFYVFVDEVHGDYVF